MASQGVSYHVGREGKDIGEDRDWGTDGGLAYNSRLSIGHFPYVVREIPLAVFAKISEKILGKGQRVNDKIQPIALRMCNGALITENSDSLS